MVNGGFGGARGRRDQSVERALSASAFLPTFGFAALGTVTVLLVAQMGIFPLGAVLGPSPRDGGRAVTTPHMSVSIGPPHAQSFGPTSSRAANRVGDPPTVITTALHVHVQADLMTKVAFVVLPGSTAVSAEPASHRAHETSEHTAEATADHTADHTAEATAEATAERTNEQANKQTNEQTAKATSELTPEHTAKASEHAKEDKTSDPVKTTQSL